MIISAKLDVLKIDKTKLFKGDKGTYLDITLLENRDGVDQYGNNFMIVQNLGKEARERGEKGPILGNGKYVGQKPVPSIPKPSPVPKSASIDDSDSIPF